MESNYRPDSFHQLHRINISDELNPTALGIGQPITIVGHVLSKIIEDWSDESTERLAAHRKLAHVERMQKLQNFGERILPDDEEAGWVWEEGGVAVGWRLSLAFVWCPFLHLD